MDKYKIISPPFTLKFDEMSKQELNDYNTWFLNQIPERIAILEKAVRSTTGFADWRVDYSPESLDKLGAWFFKQAERRKRTKEEMESICKNMPDRLKNIEVDDWELTNRTFSIAIDIGMYLSQVFLKNIPGLEWQHKTSGSKRWVDYGQPVLAGFRVRVFNPTQMMVVHAYGLVNSTRTSSSLRELYEIWKNIAEGKQIT
jgi:hypothetical protein